MRATIAGGLDTHITDILNVLRYEDLREVILVGTNYSGMVITGVAEEFLNARAGSSISMGLRPRMASPSAICRDHTFPLTL